MMAGASAGIVFWTPATIIFANGPIAARLPLVAVSQTFLELTVFVAGNVVPIFGSIVGKGVRTGNVIVLVGEAVEVTTFGAVLGADSNGGGAAVGEQQENGGKSHCRRSSHLDLDAVVGKH